MPNFGRKIIYVSIQGYIEFLINLLQVAEKLNVSL